MADPARPTHGSVRKPGALVVAAALVFVGIVLPVVASGDGGRTDPTDVFATVHGTRPTPLDEHAVERIARAFGIDAEPERIEGGWEAEDELQTLYLMKTPSAWYGTFTDSSILLGPLGDRTAICANAGAPPGCRLPDVQFVAEVAADAPSEPQARERARQTLDEAGITDERWHVVVMDPSDDVVPCRDEIRPGVDCTQQYVPTRPVILTRELGRGTTDVLWSLVIGPDGEVLTGTGRIAERR